MTLTVASLPALGPWAPPAERGPSLESIYRVSLTVDLCEGNKIISFKKIISPQPVGGPSKNKKNQRLWARAQCAHWLRRHWTLIVNTARCRRVSSSATADTYHQHDFLQDKLPLLHIFRVRDRFLASIALQLIQCEIGHRRADHVRCPISITKLFVAMTGLENLIMFDLLHSARTLGRNTLLMHYCKIKGGHFWGHGVYFCAFSALTLLVGRQEGHPA